MSSHLYCNIESATWKYKANIQLNRCGNSFLIAVINNCLYRYCKNAIDLERVMDNYNHLRIQMKFYIH